jgi:hypothetical protein
VNRLPIVSALAVLLSGCGLAGNQDVRAYNACLSRHPQDVVVCEGPRQAYEIENFSLSARSAAISGKPEIILTESRQLTQ